MGSSLIGLAAVAEAKGVDPLGTGEARRTTSSATTLSLTPSVDTDDQGDSLSRMQQLRQVEDGTSSVKLTRNALGTNKECLPCYSPSLANKNRIHYT